MSNSTSYVLQNASQCLMFEKDSYTYPLRRNPPFITIMHTFYGWFGWLHIPFGITSANEDLQRQLLAALDGLGGVI